MTYNYSFLRANRPYTVIELNLVKESFFSLIEMNTISNRTKNALYFLYRAFHSSKWMDSFIFLMCSLESLFSKDTSGGTTSAITTRVSSFLDHRLRCQKGDIEFLYEIRSKITHGKISSPNLDERQEDKETNLEYLDHLEFIAIECFKKLVSNKFYLRYINKDERNRFMGSLNT